MRDRTLVATTLLLFLPGACAFQGEEADPDGDLGSAAASGGVDLLPTSDVAKTGVVGEGDISALFRDVDDGVGSAAADDHKTYVRGDGASNDGSHVVGYSGAPAGTVTQVVVNYRANKGNASGTAQALLYDGSRQIGAGAVHTLGSWATYTDSFSGLSVADGNQLRTEIRLHRTGSHGSLYYTQIWIHLTMASPTCVPTTCADLGADCGEVADGCGGTLTCGTCSAPETCGGGGTPNVCGTSPGGDAVIVGAGDIAGSGTGDDKTAALIKNIPGTVFTLGDNAYDSGSATQFANQFNPSWGQFKDRILLPTPGNHDYVTSNATGYFGYFGAAAGDPSRGYYSKDVGAWHVIVINSNCSAIGGCGVGSPQETWLRSDLAAHPAACTLAMWHHPLFNIGNHSPATFMQPIFQALYDGNADLVLTGHDHNYQRWAPLAPNGSPDPSRGIRQFVVGTGGIGFYAFTTSSANVQSKDSSTYGVLELTLGATGYSWQFVPESGKTFTDSGSATCH
jgi:hypothetical protein